MTLCGLNLLWFLGSFFGPPWAVCRDLFAPSWGVLGASWRLLGGVLEVCGAVLEALGEPWGRLWEVLGRSWRHIRRVLDAPWVVLEPSWELWKPCCSHLEAKRLPKEEPKRALNRAVLGMDFDIDFGCVLGIPKS